MSYLLDTDTCSYIMKRSRPALLERVMGFSPGELKLSTVSLYELEFGVRRSGHSARLRRVIEAFVMNVEVLPFDSAAAREAGGIRAALTAAGTIIGAYDLFIAGHCLAIGARLVTNNVREFSRVKHLAVENWMTPPA